MQEVGRIQISRAVAFAVGLPAFIVGTAVFMLGFSLARPGILAAAASLHSVAMAALLWWLVSRRIRIEALWQGVLLLILVCALAVVWRMALIWTALRILG